MDNQQQLAAAQNEILRLREEIKLSTDELQRTLTSVSVLYQISSELSDIDNKPQAVNTLVASICKMFAIDVGIIIELHEDGASYKAVESIGIPSADAPKIAGPIKGSIFEKIFVSGKPGRLKQPQTDELPEVVRQLSVQSALLVPISPKSQPKLLLLCCRMYQGEFSFEEERIINILGNKLAEKLDNILSQDEVAQSLSLVNATIEAMSEGVLVADSDWKIILSNEQYVTMWKVPQEIMDTRDVMKITEFVAPQLVDPPAFLKKVEELRANPESKTAEVFKLKNGSVFERISIPQRVKDKTVGRVWSFHDVTSIKQAEMQLETRVKEVEEINGFMIDRELKMVGLKKEIKELQERK